MSSTRTGGFGIGFRRGGGEWQKDVAGLAAWARENGFECLDVSGLETVRAVIEAGLAVGTCDLPGWKELQSADAGKRREAAAGAGELIHGCAALGVRRFFAVLLPEDPGKDRKENFKLAVEGLSALSDVLAECDARILLEGWPGPGALGCTPETLRPLFAESALERVGVNYDPSHLLRMGIDPLRFLGEFAGRVGHIHGKDCELLSERQYELGTEQPATFAERIGFGGSHWRYTIPGQGQMRWTRAFEMLEAAGYDGFVSIELEDANFNGSQDGEKAGLCFGRAYLEGC